MTIAPAGLLDAFVPGRRAVSAEQVGAGHINRTLRLELDDGRRLIVQRVNRQVFADVEGLTRNLRLVGAAAGAAGVAVPRLLPAATGGHLWWDGDGEPWRAYDELPGTVVDPPPDAAAACAVAGLLGTFDAACRALDPGDLTVTIPRFHDLGHRVAQLTAAAAADRAGRAAERAPQIDACLALVATVEGTEGWAAWSSLPVQVVHNDAKAGNVVVDEAGRATGVIDLDTVMPGTILADVGELVRSASRASPEDVPDPSPLDEARLDAVVSGFLAGWAEPLTDAERVALPVAGAVLTLENAVRFLTDHVEGDVYFAVADPEHNLRRHRAAAMQVRALLAHAGLPSPTQGVP